MSYIHKHFVAVLPNGTEYFFEASWPEKASATVQSNEIERHVTMAVSESGIKASRKNPHQVNVPVFSLTAQEGKLRRSQWAYKTYLVTPPMEHVSDEECREDMKNILENLPEEFRPFVESWAWNNSPESSNEAILNLAESLTRELLPVLANYRKNLQKGMW